MGTHIRKNLPQRLLLRGSEAVRQIVIHRAGKLLFVFEGNSLRFFSVIIAMPRPEQLLKKQVFIGKAAADYVHFGGIKRKVHFLQGHPARQVIVLFQKILGQIFFDLPCIEGKGIIDQAAQ